MAVKDSLVDPFLIDPRADDPAHSFDVPLATSHPGELLPEQPPSAVLTPDTPPAPDDAEDQPEVFDIDGGTVTISYDKKTGWTGTLSLDEGGGDEVFRGKTQKELMTKVLAGKAKATAQIRKLNKKLKLGSPVDETPAVPQLQPFQPKPLSANDIFEIKTAMEADPDKAADLRFQKKYGMTEAELVSRFLATEKKAEKGAEAHDELSVEGVSKEFLEAHKDEYYPYAENGDAIMTWLCRNKLKRNVRTTDNFGTISGELLERGLYTVQNLEEAFEDLRDSGLLEPPPQPESTEVEETPEPVPAAPVSTSRPARQVQPAVSDSRIVSTRRQPRGGLGIRASSTGTREPEAPRAPSADELENMSDSEIRELLHSTTRLRAQGRR